MKAEDRYNYNTLIYIIVIWLVLFCFVESSDVSMIEKRIDETEATFSEQLESKDEEIKYLNNTIEELNKELDNIIMMSYDYNYVVRVVANECQNQPFEGKMAVAQTILERSLEWGMTPEQVVKQKGQYTVPMREENVSPEVWEACKLVLIDEQRVTDKPIKWFYNPSVVSSKTHQEKCYAMTIGDHVFCY